MTVEIFEVLNFSTSEEQHWIPLRVSCQDLLLVHLSLESRGTQSRAAFTSTKRFQDITPTV